VSALGKAVDTSVTHTVTSSPQSATYAESRSRVRVEGQPAPPGAAEFALREAIGAGAPTEAQAAEAAAQSEAASEAADARAEAARIPEKDVVERHRENAVRKLEDLDETARSEANQAGAIVPAFEFQVGPDARAYRVGFRDPPDPPEPPDASETAPVATPDSGPTVDRQ
jgi:hypothetical protein